jgi:hypothetical protein
MRIERVQRGSNGEYLVRLPTLKLAASDRLFVRDTSENIKEYEQALGSKLHNVAVEGSNATDAGKRERSDTDTNEEEKREQLAEIVVTDDSDLAGRTLRDARFYDRYGLAVIALHRAPTCCWFRVQYARSPILKAILRCSCSMDDSICRTRAKRRLRWVSWPAWWRRPDSGWCRSTSGHSSA